MTTYLLERTSEIVQSGDNNINLAENDFIVEFNVTWANASGELFELDVGIYNKNGLSFKLNLYYCDKLISVFFFSKFKYYGNI